MTDRDPNINGCSYTYTMDGNESLNPTAVSYAPNSQPNGNMASQVSAPSSPYLEARVQNLEEGHAELREEMDDLTEFYHKLCSSVDRLQRGGWPVTVGPFQETDLTESHQHAMSFKQELEQLSREVQKSVNGDADVEKANGSMTVKKPSRLPPHLRAAATTDNGTDKKPLPPHLRGRIAAGAHEPSSNPLVTDGPVDTLSMTQVPAPAPSPPSSPITVVQQDLPTDELSLIAWKPHFVTTLASFSSTSEIPAMNNMVTFHPEFLAQYLGGTDWSPGLRYIAGGTSCILKNRTYYLLNPVTDPYLPKKPGQHGAKLTAFFNEAPEDKFGDLPDGLSSYEDVPMFVEQKTTHGHIRYAYFGNYTQSRWSDKLDCDTMMARVPQHIKEYWATELTSPIRQEWVTQELKNHFFKKPEYQGRIYTAVEADTTIVESEDEVKLNDKMARDVQNYVEELREWDREAKMKTAMIKKQFILDAFDAADADDPPALRLWWEYLQCVDWRQDFYDLLVTLQSRKADQYLK